MKHFLSCTARNPLRYRVILALVVEEWRQAEAADWVLAFDFPQIGSYAQKDDSPGGQYSWV